MDDFDTTEELKGEVLAELSDFPGEEIVDEPKKEIPDFMKLLEGPMAQGLLGGCKDLFKKKETDPNILEITIKGPAEAVLKIMRV